LHYVVIVDFFLY